VDVIATTGSVAARDLLVVQVKRTGPVGRPYVVILALPKPADPLLFQALAAGNVALVAH
jgi:hypothetical protein